MMGYICYQEQQQDNNAKTTNKIKAENMESGK